MVKVASELDQMDLRAHDKSVNAQDQESTNRVESGYAEKRISIAQLLFRTARLYSEKILYENETNPGTLQLRPSHTALFPYISGEGVRATALAGQPGISKQAIGQLLSELEELKMIERIADPKDGRAKLVRFIEADESKHGMADLLRREEALRSFLGETDVASFHRILIRMDDWLNESAAES